MSPANVKTVFYAAIFAVLWGGYNIAKSVYTYTAWEEVQGTVVDFERNTWSCGKSVGECYSLMVGYHAGKDYFTTFSKKKYNYDPPTHLMDEKISVYYSPGNPSEAILGDGYGPMNYGIIIFLIGTLVLFIFCFINNNRPIIRCRAI